MINTCNDYGDQIYIVWQMKFKRKNFILYRNCVFTAPVDNFNPFAKTPQEKITPYGKRFKVTCSGTQFYSEDKQIKKSVRKTTSKYKDATLLERMLKIGELNLKSEDDFMDNINANHLKMRMKKTFGENGLGLSCDDYENFVKTIKIKDEYEN